MVKTARSEISNESSFVPEHTEKVNIVSDVFY